MIKRLVNTSGVLVAIGTALLILSTLLPWSELIIDGETAGTVTIWEHSGPGILFLYAIVIIIAYIAWIYPYVRTIEEGRPGRISSPAIAIWGLAIIAYRFEAMEVWFPDLTPSSDIQPGTGTTLMWLGGILIFLGGIVMTATSLTNPTPPENPSDHTTTIP